MVLASLALTPPPTMAPIGPSSPPKAAPIPPAWLFENVIDGLRESSAETIRPLPKCEFLRSRAVGVWQRRRNPGPRQQVDVVLRFRPPTWPWAKSRQDSRLAMAAWRYFRPPSKMGDYFPSRRAHVLGRCFSTSFAIQRVRGNRLYCFADRFLLRRASARPVNAIPNRPRDAGSGTDVGVPPVPAIWFTVRL